MCFAGVAIVPAALASFEAASAFDPRQIGVKIEVATELRELGRIDEAEALLRSVLASEPKTFSCASGTRSCVAPPWRSPGCASKF